jgi:predicted transposase/invertase (TIGR01784 family)
MDMLQQVEQQGGQDFISSIFCYIIKRGEISDKKAFQTLVNSCLSQETGEKVMPLAQQWYQEGHQKGHREGRQEGVEEGKLIVAASMLKQGFAPEIVAQATGISPEKVRALKKTSAEDVLPMD